jgi:hypothetical protein
MFSHIIIFGSSLPELLGGHSLCAIICGRVLTATENLFTCATGFGSASGIVTGTRPLRAETRVNVRGLPSLS